MPGFGTDQPGDDLFLDIMAGQIPQNGIQKKCRCMHPGLDHHGFFAKIQVSGNFSPVLSLLIRIEGVVTA